MAKKINHSKRELELASCTGCQVPPHPDPRRDAELVQRKSLQPAPFHRGGFSAGGTPPVCWMTPCRPLIGPTLLVRK